MVRGTSLALAILAALGLSLIVLGPRFLPYRLVPVQGASMEPTIQLGSLAVMRPIRASDVRVGDIIIFGRSDISNEFVTHRVAKIIRTTNGLAFLTKGDANGAPDAWTVPAVGTGWRYSFSIPWLGSMMSRAGSPTARSTAATALLVVLAAWILFETWRPTPALKAT